MEPVLQRHECSCTVRTLMSQVDWGIKGHFILNRVIVVYNFPVMPLELCGARSTAEIRGEWGMFEKSIGREVTHCN